MVWLETGPDNQYIARSLAIEGFPSASSLFFAPVAQLDRVPGYEPGGRRFESFRARQIKRVPNGTLFYLTVCIWNIEPPTADYNQCSTNSPGVNLDSRACEAGREAARCRDAPSNPSGHAI